MRQGGLYRCLAWCPLVLVLDPHTPPPCRPHRATLSEKARGGLGVVATGNGAKAPSLPSASLSLYSFHSPSTAFPKHIAGLLGPSPCLPPIQSPFPCSPARGPLAHPTSCLLAPPSLVCGQGPSAHGLHARPCSPTGVLDPGHMGGLQPRLVRLPSLAPLPPASRLPPQLLPGGAFSHQVLLSSPCLCLH